jgi:hypothetical protein
MKTIYLVSCAADKLTTEGPVEHLYCSTLFRKARAFILRNIKLGDEWYILCAKYGLLEPQTIIGRYDETLNAMRKPERKLWAQRVIRELRTVVYRGDAAVLLAGQKYREFLEPALISFGCQVSVPMRHMGIGQQISWLGTGRSFDGLPAH